MSKVFGFISCSCATSSRCSLHLFASTVWLLYPIQNTQKNHFFSFSCLSLHVSIIVDLVYCSHKIRPDAKGDASKREKETTETRRNYSNSGSGEYKFDKNIILHEWHILLFQLIECTTLLSHSDIHFEGNEMKEGIFNIIQARMQSEGWPKWM